MNTLWCRIPVVLFFSFSMMGNALGDAKEAPLTLEDAVATALAFHPKIAAAESEAKAAKAEKTAQSGLPDPRAGIMFEEVPYADPDLKNADMTSISVSQEIPFPGKLITRGKAYGADHRARLAMLTGTKRDIAFETESLFFSLYALKEARESETAVRAAYREVVASLETTYASDIRDRMGETSLFSDLMMAKAKLALSESELLHLTHEVQTAAHALALFMGEERMHGEERALKEPPLPILSLDFSDLEAKLLSENSELAAMGATLERREKEEQLAKLEFVPDLEVEFEHNARADMENAYTLGFSINVPLWGYRNRAEISAAKKMRKAAEFDLAATAIEKKRELAHLVHYVKIYRDILAKYRAEILPAGKSAMNAAITAYTANRLEAMETVNQITNYHTMVREYWETWTEYQMNYAMLEALVGEKL